MCMRDFMTKEIGHMDMETFVKILQGIVPYSIKLNWRGEPLLHPHIRLMITHAKNAGVHETSLNTNGLLLIGTQPAELAFFGLDWLIISVDGATKQTYEGIRQGGDFEKLFKNIVDTARLYSGLPEYGLKFNVPKIRIQICRQPANEHEIERWKEIFSPYADKLRVGKLFDPQGKYGYKVEQPKSCTSLWQRLTIAWNGDVYPCPSAYLEKFRLGNIKDKSIRYFWHSEKMRYYRWSLARYGRQGNLLCRNCTSYCR